MTGQRSQAEEFPMVTGPTESSDAFAESIGHPRADALAAVAELFAALEALDVEAAMTHFGPDAMYYDTTHQSGGDGQHVRAYVDWFGKTAEGFRTEIHEQLAFGSLVVNERTDHWIIDGAELHVPAVGVFETEEGSIVSWLDTTSQDLDELPPPAPAAEIVTNDPALKAGDALPAIRPIRWVTAVDVDAEANRIAVLEGEVHEWRRRAVIWRERARTAQTLADALRANLDDLRQLVRALEMKESTESNPGDIDPATPAVAAPPSPRDTRPAPTWKRVLSKDFWKELS